MSAENEGKSIEWKKQEWRGDEIKNLPRGKSDSAHTHTREFPPTTSFDSRGIFKHFFRFDLCVFWVCGMGE